MRSTSHFRKSNRCQGERKNDDEDQLVVTKEPVISPVHEIKNQNKLVNSAMFYFSHEEARDHGFRADPRIPYSAYFFEEPEKNEGKLRFGENRTIIFDYEEEVEKLVARKPETNKMPRHKHKDAKLKSVLKKTTTTVVPHEPHSDPYIDACRELMAKCFNMCSISLEELDINEMFDALGKLIFGISSEFKIKELCYNYVTAAKKRKHFEEIEALKSSIEGFRGDKSELTDKITELTTRLQEQSARNAELEQEVKKLDGFDSIKEENTGLALVNSDLASANNDLNQKLDEAINKIKDLEKIKEENIELISKVSELSSSNSELSSANTDLKSVNKELKSNNAKLIDSNKELIASKTEFSSRNTALALTNAELTNKLEEKKAKVRYLESQASSIKAKYDRDTKADMKYFKTKINDLINENVNLTAEIDKAKVDFKHANDKINDLLKENSALHSDSNNMLEDLERKLKDIKDLQSEIKESKNALEMYDNLKAEKKVCDKVLKELEREHKVFKERLKDVKDVNAKLLGQNRDLNNYKKAANDVLYELNEKVDRLDRLTSSLREEKKSDEVQIKDLNHQLKESAKAIESIETVNLGFKKRSQVLENKWNILQTKHEQLLKQHKSQELEIQQARISMREMASTLYNTRISLKSFNPGEQENKDTATAEEYSGEEISPSNSTKPHGRKRDILRSLANRKSLLVTEHAQGFNKNVY